VTRQKPSTDRYADALVALGEAAGVLGRLEDDVGRVLELLKQQPDIPRFLRDPAIRLEGKQTALAELLHGKIQPVLLHFLSLLLEQGAFAKFDRIAERFFGRLSELREETAGELVTAAPLPPGKTEAIEQAAGRMLGRDLHIRVRVDPTLLGGMRLKVGDFIVDGTIDRQLDLIRKSLLS
jgi:ATP synthase F1 delta subunit